MSKTIKELAEELSQYFEEGNEQEIVLLLNNCNRDKLLAKAYDNPQLNSQGTLLVDNEHFSKNESSSMHNKAIELAKCIKQELWEKCVELATNNDDCSLGEHPAIKYAIKSKISEIQSTSKVRELLADAMKEPKANESDDDFELVEAHEEGFELVEESKAGFVMVGKSGETLDHPNVSHTGGKSNQRT